MRSLHVPMSVELGQEVSPQAAAALVAHLRQNPEHARLSAEELALRFGLSESFVGSVLEGLNPPDSEPAAEGFQWQPTLDRLREFGLRLRRLIDATLERPDVFVAVTLMVGLLLGSWFQSVRLPDFVAAITSEDLGTTLVVFATLAAHMFCYFYRRMVRHALVGSLMVWVGLGTLLMYHTWRAMPSQAEPDRFGRVMMAGAATFLLSAMYAGFGSLMAVLGGWTAIKIRERREERMSRQDLLQRYFELQTRLQNGNPSRAEGNYWDRLPPVQAFRQNPYLFSFLTGFCMQLLTILILFPLGDPDLRHADPALSPLVFSIVILTGIAMFLTYIAAGFLVARLRKAALLAVLLQIGGALPTALPIGQYGPDYLLDPTRVGSFGFGTLMMVLVTVFAALGGIVQQRNQRERNLQSNDQASLVAEMLRIQWRLADHVSEVCVMVVDAAKSSLMKAEADPLAVEYSFREYQEWLEEISIPLGGRVHSTAGDGAVISFPTTAGALAAARQIQTDLGRFNQDVNRLSSPFRLRVGLHCGEVAGDIDEVQFSEVIDVAAHVQELSPIGGVAVTDSVAGQLPSEEFMPLPVETDGHRVFLAMGPVTG